MDKVEVLWWVTVISVIAVLFGSITVAVFDKAYHHYQEHHVGAMNESISDPPKDTRPVIPDCGKSRWDEVRGECNGTEQ